MHKGTVTLGRSKSILIKPHDCTQLKLGAEQGQEGGKTQGNPSNMVLFWFNL